jgi:hypothetical protein
MALVFAETPDATQGNEFFNNNASTPTVVANPGFPSGVKAHKFDTGATPADQYLGRNTVLADAGRRISWYVWFDNLPAADQPIWTTETSGGSGRQCLYLKSTGILELRDADRTAVLGTGTHALTTGAAYRLAIAFVITSTTSYTFTVWVNGTLDITVTNTPTLQGTGTSTAYWGWNFTGGTPPAGTNKVCYIGHVCVDDSTALTDPGDVRVTAKLPTSTVTNGFLGTNGGTGAVNERPLSVTNFKLSTATGTQDQTYNIETAAGGDVNVSTATLIGNVSWVYAKNSTTTSTGQLWDRNATTAILLTTTNTLFFHATTSAAYPTAGQSNAGIESATKIVTLYECGVLIVYLPGTVFRRPNPVVSQAVQRAGSR